MTDLLAENGVTKAACARVDCGIRLGRLLKVDKVIVGQVLLRGKEVYIHSGLIQVQQGTEKRSAQAIFKLSENIMPFSKNAEKMAYMLMDKNPPGLSWKTKILLGISVAGGGVWLTYQLTRPKEGDVQLIVSFPIEEER